MFWNEVETGKQRKKKERVEIRVYVCGGGKSREKKKKKKKKETYGRLKETKEKYNLAITIFSQYFHNKF